MASEAHWLKCPICLDPPSTTPVQCHNGHVVCRPCSQKIQRCPICRSHMNPQRPIWCRVVTQALEQSSQHRVCRCRGGAAGCTWMGENKSLAAHENQCLYFAKTVISELKLKIKELEKEKEEKEKEHFESCVRAGVLSTYAGIAVVVAFTALFSSRRR